MVLYFTVANWHLSSGFCGVASRQQTVVENQGPGEMEFEPFGWNAVVVGAWNRAIFTPAWIGQNLFRLPAGTPIPVEIPIHARAPWRVRHDQEQLAVLVGNANLEIAVDSCDYAHLDAARSYATRAISELPKTPLSAAGYNVRWRIIDISPEVAGLAGGDLDPRIGRTGLTILDRSVRRSVTFRDGVINLELSLSANGDATLQLNFHMDSNIAATLEAWLTVPIDEVESHANRLLLNIRGG